MKKFAILGILSCALVAAPSFAQVVVRVAPPPVIVEHPGPPPRAGYIWTPGYHRWDGARYVWVPGRYAYPPRPQAVSGCRITGRSVTAPGCSWKVTGANLTKAKNAPS